MMHTGYLYRLRFPLAAAAICCLSVPSAHAGEYVFPATEGYVSDHMRTTENPSTEEASLSEFQKKYRDPDNPKTMLPNPVTGRPFTETEIITLWHRFQNLENDQAHRQIILLSNGDGPDSTVEYERSLHRTPQSEKDILATLMFFDSFAGLDWRDQKQFKQHGTTLLRGLRGLNRSRFNTAVASINQMEPDALAALIGSDSRISLAKLKTFFRQDKRVFGYAISRTPKAENMLKSLGGVKAVADTVGMLNYNKLALTLDTIDKTQSQASK